MRCPHPAGDSPVENKPITWGQPSSRCGKNLRKPLREPFPQQRSPGHASCPQVIHKAVHTPLLCRLAKTRGYPQRPSAPNNNYIRL
jgi:hypothetical protein